MEPFQRATWGGKGKTLLVWTLVLLLVAPGGAVAIDDDLLRLIKGDLSEKLAQGDTKSLYTVRKGDTLWGIARRHKMDLDTLLALNDLKSGNPIRPGLELVVEGAPKEDDRAILPAAAQFPEGSRGAVLSGFQWPLVGSITSPFGLRQDPNNPAKEVFHHGLDIAGDTGDPIRAVHDGVVAFVGTKPIYGKTIIIQHGEGIKTVYAHLSKYAVKKGDKVERGEVIGRCGDTGVTTGPHLHLEVHVDGEVVNPLLYLKGRSRDV